MKRTIRNIFITAIIFVLSAAAAGAGSYYASGILLMGLAAGLFIENVKVSGRLFGPAAFLSLSWIGGAGVSALKLSRLQSEWCMMTWIVIFLTYVCFLLGAELYVRLSAAGTGTGRSGMPVVGTATGQEGMPEAGAGTGQEGMPVAGAGTGQEGMPAAGTGTGRSGMSVVGTATGQEGMPVAGAGTGQEGMPVAGTGTGQEGMPVAGTGTGQEGMPVAGAGTGRSGMPAAVSDTAQKRLSAASIKGQDDEPVGDLHPWEDGRGSYAEGLLLAVNIVTFLSLAAFIVEAGVLGYIPLFTSGVPHAYSYFHISGVHYFTVSCVLVLPLIVLYLGLYAIRPGNIAGPFSMDIGLAGKADLLLCAVISFLLPILMVSRYELIMTLGLSVLTAALSTGWKKPSRITLRQVVIVMLFVAVFLTLYIFITYERAHSAEYLNGIYEMKDPRIPVFISQPYIYIANNYDNLNCLIETLSGQSGVNYAAASEAGTAVHSLGLRMLFPVFALTGLKFKYADLISFPLYVTKEELTTVSLVYDAYYDFGIIGVICFALVLGALSGLLERSCRAPRPDRPMLVLAYAQVLFYLGLSFFTTWFSNATTWFYLIATLAMGVFIRGYVWLREYRRKSK